MSQEFHANCAYCGRPADLIRREYRIRRGDRVLPVLLPTWECGHGCVAHEKSSPFRFVDAQLAREHALETAAAWLAAFGEPLPAPKPPGRKPRERRTVDVHLLLTPTEAAQLDAMRAGRSRAEFIREKLRVG